MANQAGNLDLYMVWIHWSSLHNQKIVRSVRHHKKQSQILAVSRPSTTASVSWILHYIQWQLWLTSSLWFGRGHKILPLFGYIVYIRVKWRKSSFKCKLTCSVYKVSNWPMYIYIHVQWLILCSTWFMQVDGWDYIILKNILYFNLLMSRKYLFLYKNAWLLSPCFIYP